MGRSRLRSTKPFSFSAVLCICIFSATMFGASKSRHAIRATPNGLAASPSLTPCDAVKREHECRLTIDGVKKQSTAVLVHNNAKVTVHVNNKPPFSTCSISAESRTAEKPDSSISTVLTLAGGLGTTLGGTALKTMVTGGAPGTKKEEWCTSEITTPKPLPTPSPLPSPTPLPTPAAAPRGKEAHDIAETLSLVNNEENNKQAELEQTRDAYSNLSMNVAGYLNPGKPFCSDKVVNEGVTRAIRDIEGELGKNSDFPSLDAIDDQLSSVQRAILGYANAHPEDIEWNGHFQHWLRTLSGEESLYAEQAKRLGAARTQLWAMHDYLRSKDFHISQDIALVPDQNSVTTGNLTCVDDQSKTAWDQDVPLTVTYDELPRWSFSAGVLFSSQGRLQFGIRPSAATVPAPPPSPTPTPVKGNATVLKTDSSSFQVVPFSFASIRLWDWVMHHQQFSLGLAGGLGVNPNNGDNQAEFFEGLSVTWKNVSFYAGSHNARQQILGGNFALNEVVDPQTVGSLPINHDWVHKFAGGISYRIPPN